MNGLNTLLKFSEAPLAAFQLVAGRGHAEVRGGFRRFHFIDDPHLAQRLLLAKEFAHDPMVYEQLRPITGQQGMVQLVGAESRDLRSQLRPLMGKDGLQILEAIIDEEVDQLARDWSGQSVVALTEAIYRLTWRINYRFICGDDRLHHSEELFASFQEIGRICGKRMRRLVPLPRWLPPVESRRLRSARRLVVRLLTEVMESREKGRLSVLELLPPGSLALDQLTTMIWAGHETTASGIITSLHYLSRDVRLQEQVAGNRKQATRVFKESIRLHPPAYMLVRQVKTSTDLEGVHFRKGDHVVVSLFNMHRRADLFPDPERFDPSRYDAKAYPLGYLPFGLGAKRCFGEPISYFEASKVLAELTARYTLAPGEHDLEFETDVTLVPRTNFALRLTPKSMRGATG